ncbi:MAG: hypothetical protein APF84_11390 [Gracilibacter sp. BRH_c7a]|nr:MAG: hypothetical protein APF84_11390 [Gracilibacter sp. BRH_c7a]
MHFRNDFKTLYNEIEKFLKRDQHRIVDEAKFMTLKKDILDIIKTLFGEGSRQYRVVKLTNSPATVFKVMNHIAASTETRTSAVNM